FASGCSGQLESSDPNGSTNDPQMMNNGTAGTGGTVPNPTGNPPPVVNTPEPMDWYSAVQNTDCSGAPTLSRTRIRRLSNVQFANTVQAALGATIDPTTLPADAISSSTWFNTDATENTVNVLLANAYYDEGETLATAAAASAIATYPCLSTQAAMASCNAAFIADYGQRLFRRPLTDEEKTRYGGLLTEQAALDAADIAVGTVIRAMLLSPNMIFLTELGSSAAGEVALTPYEQASLISYLIADMPPDQALLQAAAAGQLGTDRLSHAQRLLQTPAARAKFADFWTQYLPEGDLRQATMLPANVVTAMGAEPATQFDKIVWDQGGSFKDLLTASYTYGDTAMSEIYGSMTPDGTPGRSALPAGERSGFATEPAVLFTSPDSTQPHKVIQRGLVVRNRLLCMVPAPPPPGLVPNPADLITDPNATARENYEAFAADKPACAACHEGFQPFGLAFEAYDDQGRYRETYPNGDPILTAGEIKNAGDATGPYATAVELAGRIGNSQIGEYCFARQYADYALGRHLASNVDACTIQALGDTAPDSAVKQLAVILGEREASSNRFHTVVQ
ncbi:MAG TPA: DUF1592 domain-containing protein, partial [Polyangiaceae bacterium]|nr:DUF1592 domain-containing protein [Polyangiaceae bacterium]